MTYDVRGRPLDVLERAISELPRTHEIDLTSHLIRPSLFLAMAGHVDWAVQVWRRVISPGRPPLNHAYRLGPLVAASGGAGINTAPDGTAITEADLDRIDMDARLRLMLPGSPSMRPFVEIQIAHLAPGPDYLLPISAFRLAHPADGAPRVDRRPSKDEERALAELEEWFGLPEHPTSSFMDEQARLVAADIAERLGDSSKARALLQPWIRAALDESSAIDLGTFFSLRSLSRLAATGILKEDLELSEADCQELGARLVEAADRRLAAGRQTPSASFDWRVFLQEISAKALAETDQLAIQESISGRQRKTGWLGEPPATETQIAAAEARLGVRLPPSYRAFLETSNGFGPIATSVFRMRPAEEIDWFRTAEPETVAIWLKAGDEIGEREDDAAYRQYGNHQGPMRKRYLKTALMVSDYQEGVVLLIPDVVTSAGEWEAWLLVDDAWRFPSFRELMEEGTLART